MTAIARTNGRSLSSRIEGRACACPQHTTLLMVAPLRQGAGRVIDEFVQRRPEGLAMQVCQSMSLNFRHLASLVALGACSAAPPTGSAKSPEAPLSRSHSKGPHDHRHRRPQQAGRSAASTRIASTPATSPRSRTSSTHPTSDRTVSAAWTASPPRWEACEPAFPTSISRSKI